MPEGNAREYLDKNKPTMSRRLELVSVDPTIGVHLQMTKLLYVTGCRYHIRSVVLA